MGELKLQLYKPNNVFNDLLKPKNKRQNGDISIIFHSLIGIKTEESIYINEIYNLFDKLKESNINYIFLENGLDMDLEEKFVQDMNVLWVTVTKLKNPSSRQILDLTFRYHRKPIINNDVDHLIRENLSNLMDLFRQKQGNLNILKNFYLKFINWIEKYIPQLLKEGLPTSSDRNITFIYWGTIKRDEVYFLLLLSWLGIDVLYLNTNNMSGLGELNILKTYYTLDEFELKKEFKKFPKRPHIVRQETIASIATREIEEVLHQDINGFFKPWQFEKYNTKIVPLKTTYEELLILWKESSQFRTGFNLDNISKTVYVPSLFTKICGVPDNIEMYWVDVEELRDYYNTVFIDGLPFTPSIKYHNQNILLKNGKFLEDDVKNLKEYKFHYLRPSIQSLIINKINDLIEMEGFFKFNTLTMDFKYKVLHTILNLDKRFINQLQTFDFADKIPKLVIYDGDENVCNDFDAIILGFLHLVGFDIVILTPTGYQNIEHLIESNSYDTHKRERFEFNLNIPEITLNSTSNVTSNNNNQKKSFISRLFNLK